MMEGIREATYYDGEKIYPLLIALEGADIDFSAFIRIFEENLNTPLILYFVYEEDKNILGFISIHIQRLLHHVGTIAEIQEIIVDEAARGKGIGKQLFQKAVNVSQEYGCLQLEVCCNQKRKEAHAFYEAQAMKNTHYKFCMPLG